MVKIDFVSDISCPFCAIGLKSLETALARVPNANVELHFEPFELNPYMAPEGEEINEHLASKYGGSPAQYAGTREHVRQRGEAVGFKFDMSQGFRIYNTLDAHRLLHWAGLQDLALQKTLKMALFQAYFTDKKDPSAESVLLDAAAAAGLDVDQAREILRSDLYKTEVREAEKKWQRKSIHSVPTIIVNDTDVISGGQPPEAFERILRKYT
ncbi:Aste57867_10563 [Aphanomyces stellatus]|uniref:Aste57867_10563 protein n=1 Tax=Aphanomyces stellatus TaxID=120398 RepID=A0A485KRC7_9STRA|nr:hypothetical protein As57867_010523 [Aphanomyces stellatus]VFT87436.1 Aste57867_10563 [Aphanomyces stellatus]